MKPLAIKYRPHSLNDIVGQDHLIPIFKKMIQQQHLMSVILFGPPGTGKTTLATIIAKEANLKYHLFNAVTGNKQQLDTIFEEIKFFPKIIVIIDEIHRLNKDKQDLLLPYIESGKLILIGATTSNPLLSINPAIRSRVILLEVKKPTINAIAKRLQFVELDYFKTTLFEKETLLEIASHCNGDIRYAINVLEFLSIQEEAPITVAKLQNYIQIPNLSTDKNSDGHYDLVSAFQKSIRGSDVNAALYYLAALIESNDHDSIYRRLAVTAYEDIGLANPNLVSRVANIIQLVQTIGLIEGRILLANAVIELCLSPKSKSAEQAIDAARIALNQYGLIIPEYLKLTPVLLDNDDKYDYSRPDLWQHIQYLPKRLQNKQFYIPGNNQYETILSKNYQTLNKNRTANLKNLKRNKTK